MEARQGDVCRVCRSEGTSDKPLYHPCVCTGSIKYIHQDCLVQWLKYSKKEYCELCKHRYAFTPIYAPDMPKRLPIKDLVTGLLNGILRAVRYWLHYTLVAFAWLGIVPLTACRIYRCLFNGSLGSVLTLPLDLLSTDNIVSDCFQGCFIVTCTLCTFISLVWLREQIMNGGGPEWLDVDQQAAENLVRPNNNPPDNNANNAAGVAAENQADVAGEAGEEHGEQVVDDGDDDHEDNENNGQGQEEVNWNPMDWDRAAEDLTWERLLGLDGSLLFMEHVFWVVSLNTLFIMVFAFSPYHIGHFAVVNLHLQELVIASHFEGLLTTLGGYIIIAMSLACLHLLASFCRWAKAKRMLGLCYVAVKVSLLVVMEIGFFPLICGWWLDICSLNMFEATLKDRENSFRLAPGNSMFIHWLVGMVYIFYFASFILLLREVLRPGVLWFLRNLNDPDFNPIQEMIHLPVLRHVRRFLASMVVFGTIVLVMLWLPVQVVRKLFPNFLPFYVMLSSDTPVSELSLELLLLQVVLPALLEQGHTRQWLKAMVKGWCIVAAWLLDLRSYLLGDVPFEESAATDKQEDANNAAESNEVPADGDAQLEPDAADETAAGASKPSCDGAETATAAKDEEGTNSCDMLSDRIVSFEVDLPSNSCGYSVEETSELKDVDIAGEQSDNSTSELHENTVSIISHKSSRPAEDASACPEIHVVSVTCEADETESIISNVPNTGLLQSAQLAGDHLKDQEALSTVDEYDVVVELADRSPASINCQKDNIDKPAEETLASAVGQIVLADAVVLSGIEPVEDNKVPVTAAGKEAPQDVNVIPEMPPVANGGVIVNAEMPPIAEGEMPVVNEAAEAVPAQQAAVDAVQPLAFIAVPPAQGLGDMHQAMMQAAGPVGFQPYKRPNMFALRLMCLLVLVCITLFLASLASLLIPVYIGRQLMSIWTGETKVHELYTVACGLYACWVVLRMSMILYTWIPQGWHVIFGKVVEWTILVSKSLFVAVILIGIVPLMLGLIFELVIVMPIRVPLEMTPIFFPWQDWALGVLHAKIITAATMMGPQWRLKRVIEQVYQQGLRNMNLKYIMVELCLPVLICLGLILAVPHIIAKSIVPALGFDFETQNLVLRRIYPFILGVILFVTFCIFQARQFWRLYEHIKNDKYLVGQRLVNYERQQVP